MVASIKFSVEFIEKERFPNEKRIKKYPDKK